MIFEGTWVFSEEKKTGSVRIESENGVIRSVERIDALPSGRYVGPGFLDAQVNGYRGSDYSLDDLDVDHIRHIALEMAKSGATKHIATVITSPKARILRNLDLIAQTVMQEEELRGAVPGLHVEGPYISDEDGPRGAHDAKYIRDPDTGELAEWIDAAKGLLRVVTLAPERKGSVEYIEALREAGIVPAIGHTGATPEEIRRAVDAGALLSTHLGNGSHAMLPRLKNYLWEQLASDELAMGLICDGFHVPAAVVKSLVRAKGLNRTILVSDVALYGGVDPGRYVWGNIEIEVHPDGHLGVADTPYLAGAGHTLSWAIPRFIEFTGASMADTVRLCTSNPASLLGIALSEELPKPGDPADLIQFHYLPGGKSLEIERVVRGSFSL